MADHKVAKRIFLVACPRSGTTLLQSILSAHPRIYSMPETHFFSHLFGGRMRRKLVSSTLRGIYGWVLLLRLQQARGLRLGQAIHHTGFHISKRNVVAEFSRVMDAWTVEVGKDAWVEKTPGHLEFISTITRGIPSAQIIHLVRDGRAVVASLHRLAQLNTGDWDRYIDLDVAIERWNRSLALTGKYRDSNNHLVVQYESLIDRPEWTVREICNAVHIEYDPSMLSSFHESAGPLVRGDEYWKRQNLEPVLASNDKEKFRSVFSESQQQYIDRTLDWSLYSRLGFTKAWK